MLLKILPTAKNRSYFVLKVLFNSKENVPAVVFEIRVLCLLFCQNQVSFNQRGHLISVAGFVNCCFSKYSSCQLIDWALYLFYSFVHR